MNQILKALQNLSVAVALLVSMLVGALLFMAWGLLTLINSKVDPSTSLPLLAIGGVIMLILLLTIVAVIFWLLDLADKSQAMGLPEGSIRAVIALSLIVLFAILAVFLYEGVNGPVSTIEYLSEADRSEFFKAHPTAQDVQSVLAKDPTGQPIKKADGTPVYTVTYRSGSNATSNDFAKQLLVLLGTLMTAITSFYLGAGTATSAASAAAQAVDLAKTLPTITSVHPTQYSISNNGPLIHLQVLGNNLNIITHVKIVRAGVQVIGTNVASNPTSVTCDIAVSKETTPPGSPWDVVIDDGASKSTTLKSALTIAE
jgi:hypothetical protein